MLTVPAPTLAYEPVGPGTASLELPLAVALAPVTDDGRQVGPADLLAYGLVVHRRTTPWAPVEAWDPIGGHWLPALPGMVPPSLPMAFLEGTPQPWQAVVVPVATTAASGTAAFVGGVGGSPSYGFAGLFVSHDEGAVLGEDSASVAFVSVSDRNLVVLGAGEGEQVESATEARLLLRSPGLATIGGLVVERSGAGAQVTVSNAAGASVVLRADGSIELRPAGGSRVEVAGDLETGRITYEPAGGGSKKTLT